jgi:hypothetical protein
MKEISSIVLKDNNHLTIPEIIFARLETLLTLEEIDLAGVDLSNVKFAAGKKFVAR